MKRMKRLYTTAQVAICILSVFLLSFTLGCEVETETLRPIVFVHGMAGSADQFSLQAQRFACNGYPADYISGFEYDTTLANNNIREIMAAMDAHIDSVLAETGADKVDLVGHSMGTMVSQGYLANRTRAAKVAHYVNADGMTKNKLPGGVPTLALWAELSLVTGVEREVTGATNITLPSQTHVQCPTSAEGFIEMYKFFKGEEPETVDVLPEDSETITMAGKMITFATNVIPQGYTLKVYEVNPATGQRTSDIAVYEQVIGTDGRFAFDNAEAGKNYEFSTYSASNPTMTQHFYYETTIRSNLLMRLKISEADSTLGENVEISVNQTNLTVVRDKEFVGNAEDHPDNLLLVNDSLTIDGREVCTADAMPIKGATIGLYVFDANIDQTDDLSQPLPAFASVPFVNAVDLYIPSASPPTGIVSIVLKGRQNGDLTQQINVPNWSSLTDKVTVQFRAF